MSWYHKNDPAYNLAQAKKNKHDVSYLMKVAGGNLGINHWNRFCAYQGTCGIFAQFQDVKTLKTYMFSLDQKIISQCPLTENLFFHERTLSEMMQQNQIDLNKIKIDYRSHFLIVIHLQSDNRVLIRKVPKNPKVMFGSTKNRDKILQAMGKEKDKLGLIDEVKINQNMEEMKSNEKAEEKAKEFEDVVKAMMLSCQDTGFIIRC